MRLRFFLIILRLQSEEQDLRRRVPANFTATVVKGTQRFPHLNAKEVRPRSTHILQYEPLQIKENAICVQKSAQTINTKEQVLRTRTIHWVKVLWENHSLEEAT